MDILGELQKKLAAMDALVVENDRLKELLADLPVVYKADQQVLISGWVIGDDNDDEVTVGIEGIDCNKSIEIRKEKLMSPPIVPNMYSNDGTKWSDDDIEWLMEACNRNEDLDYISRVLYRSPKNVIVKIKQENLKMKKELTPSVVINDFPTSVLTVDNIPVSQTGILKNSQGDVNADKV